MRTQQVPPKWMQLSLMSLIKLPSIVTVSSHFWTAISISNVRAYKAKENSGLHVANWEVILNCKPKPLKSKIRKRFCNFWSLILAHHQTHFRGQTFLAELELKSFGFLLKGKYFDNFPKERSKAIDNKWIYQIILYLFLFVCVCVLCVCFFFNSFL